MVVDIEFGSFTDGDDGEYKGVGFVAISKIFSHAGSFFFEQNHLTEFISLHLNLLKLMTDNSHHVNDHINGEFNDIHH